MPSELRTPDGSLAAKRELPNRQASESSLDELLVRLQTAQRQFAEFSQEAVDENFRRAAIAANGSRIELAKLAVAETGMGVVEDKVIKNHFAAEHIFNKY
jgi:acetaldehyde dehydrogenase/alcohol dehydrogenase